MNQCKYKTILIKLSGEALMGDDKYGISAAMVELMALEIKSVYEMDLKIAVVVGGGNIFRGLDASRNGIERSTADYMGMLATVMNALAMQNGLEKNGVPCRVQSAIEMREVAEPFIKRRAMRHLEKKRVVIFAAGTGNPFFTTDTAAALRAAEINADLILKATKVDGVYSDDPFKNQNAKKFDKITYMEVLSKSLAVMDLTAISLCMDNNVPIIVFDMKQKGNIKKAVLGEPIGTTVGG